MGENPQPESHLTMCADMGENPQSATARPSTFYSMASQNIVHDAGDLPAPKVTAPKLADLVTMNLLTIPAEIMPPPPKVPPKKAAPVLPAALQPHDGKHPGRHP